MQYKVKHNGKGVDIVYSRKDAGRYSTVINRKEPQSAAAGSTLISRKRKQDGEIKDQST